jgi:maltoporin
MPYACVSLGTSTPQADAASGSGVANANHGVPLYLEHVQSKVLGGDNTFIAGYGTGASSPLNQLGWGSGTSPDPSLTQANRTLRLVDALTIELDKRFAMQGLGSYQQSRDAAGGRTLWTSLGVRPCGS